MRRNAALPRPSLAVILRWSGALVALGLLTVALLLQPFQLYAVRTGSMEPAFAPRSLVLVHKGGHQQGQPITFTHNGEVITHRWASVNENGALVTKGDANATADPWVVKPLDTIGGVVASVPQLGYWLVYLKTIPGLGSLVVAIVGICLVWSIARECDEDPVEQRLPPVPRCIPSLPASADPTPCIASSHQ